ncbi:MAG: Sec-independent protein translocase subunit TatA/TatB [Chloroflexota bacterium]
MDIFGIGPTELVFIVLIALIILGPKDMQKAGRTIGRWLRNLVTSDGWRVFRDTSRELRSLPNRLMREASLEELDQVNQEIGKIGAEVAASPLGKGTADKNPRQERFGTWGSPAPPPPPKPAPAEATKGAIASPAPPTAQPDNKPEATSPAGKETESHA